MPKITIEIETPDVDQLLAEVREIELADDIRVTACSEVRRMNGSIVIQGSYPDHVNPDGLLVIFDLDGRTLPCSWLDVPSPPSRGSAIRLDSLNAGDGAAIVRAHGWLEHNLVMVYLDRVSNDEPVEPEQAVGEALALISRYGGIDGEHHKQWLLDQVVRTLAGDRYQAWVKAQRAGELGPETYEWSEGVAP